jgi:hypothetical protein
MTPMYGLKDVMVSRNSVLDEVLQAIYATKTDQWSMYYNLIVGMKDVLSTSQASAESDRADSTKGRDHYRGMPCRYKENGVWVDAKFVALDLVGFEPMVQAPKRMPVFATWGTVDGLPKAELHQYYAAIASTT